MTEMKRPPVVINLHVEAFSRDATMTVDRDEWDAMTPAEREAYADEAAEAFASNYVSQGWHIEDPDDYAATGD